MEHAKVFAIELSAEYAALASELFVEEDANRYEFSDQIRAEDRRSPAEKMFVLEPEFEDSRGLDID